MLKGYPLTAPAALLFFSDSSLSVPDSQSRISVKRSARTLAARLVVPAYLIQ